MDQDAANVFRSRTSATLAIVGWTLIGVAAVSVVVLAVTGAPVRVWALIPLALFAVLIFEAFWRPTVIVDDTAVVLDEPFRTVTIPWSAVVDIETRWALTIVTPHGRYRSSAAPAPGVLARPGTVSRHEPVAAQRVSDALGTDSGDAAHIVRRRWQKLIESESVPLGRAHLDRATTRIHRGALVAAIALGAATIPAMLLLA